AAGGGALLLVLVAAGATMGITPWAAWREAAGRPALVFSGRSAWVTDGERFVRRATLAFDEAHRVVAVTPGTFRVIEADGARRVVVGRLRDARRARGGPGGLAGGSPALAAPRRVAARARRAGRPRRARSARAVRRHCRWTQRAHRRGRGRALADGVDADDDD